MMFVNENPIFFCLGKFINIKANQPELLDEAFGMLRDQAENATVSSSTYKCMLFCLFCSCPIQPVDLFVFSFFPGVSYLAIFPITQSVCAEPIHLRFLHISLFSRAQGTRMEERLDDAINVLRSHCEPQLNMPIGGMDAAAALAGHPSFVPTQPPQNQSAGLSQASMPQDAAVAAATAAAVSLAGNIPVKVERNSVPSASSESMCRANCAQ